jgi:RNA recognition motif-containing protein
MITLCVRGLPRSTTEDSLLALFADYGTVRSHKLVKDLFSGECKGIAIVEMEGHEARAAIAGLDGKSVQGEALRVGPERYSKKGNGRGRR